MIGKGPNRLISGTLIRNSASFTWMQDYNKPLASHNFAIYPKVVWRINHCWNENWPNGKSTIWQWEFGQITGHIVRGFGHFKKRATNKSVISSSKGVRKRQEFLHANISTSTPSEQDSTSFQKMHSKTLFHFSFDKPLLLTLKCNTVVTPLNDAAFLIFWTYMHYSAFYYD